MVGVSASRDAAEGTVSGPRSGSTEMMAIWPRVAGYSFIHETPPSLGFADKGGITHDIVSRKHGCGSLSHIPSSVALRTRLRRWGVKFFVAHSFMARPDTQPVTRRAAGLHRIDRRATAAIQQRYLQTGVYFPIASRGEAPCSAGGEAA